MPAVTCENIFDWPELPEPSEKVVEAGRKWLLNNRDTFDNQCGAMTNFAIISKEGEAKQSDSIVCHSGIAYDAPPCPAVIATEIGTWRMGRVGNSTDTAYPISLYLPFIDWLCQSSCYSPFILNRDELMETREYGIVVSGNIPTEFMINILIMSRMVVEANPFAFEVFNHLYMKEDLPGSVAYAFAFHTKNSVWDGNGVGYKENSVSATDRYWTDFVFSHQHHRPSGLFTTVDALKNFCEGKMTKTCYNDTYKERQWLYGGSEVFSAGGFTTPSKVLDIIEDTVTEYPEFLEALKTFRGDAGKVVGEQISIPNPFSSNPPSPTSEDVLAITYREMAECFLPFLKSKGVFDNACH